MRKFHLSRAIVPLTLSVALLATACGTEETPEVADTSEQTPDDSAAQPATEAFPVTVTTANGEVTMLEQPAAIVSLSPTSTEMLFAIGAGDQVVAVDEFSNHPAEAPVTDLSGYTPNLEAISTFEPDLVIFANPGEVVDGLIEVGIPTAVFGAAVTLDDVYTQIEQLGALTGHVAEAAELVANMTTDFDEIVSTLPEEAAGLTYYHELGPDYFSVTSATFIGVVYAELGLVNIADPADDGSAFGYPQLSAEFIIEADPDLIFLADTKCCAVTAASVAERDGWANLRAVANGAVVELDDDIASRWGPRIIDYLRVVADAVHALVGASA